MITGNPLLQDIDFELSFGGATFRHVRTYSEQTARLGLRTSGNWTPWWRDTFWDWNGMFWMMGENPIFLIDMKYVDEVGNELTGSDPKRCYFIPDAHHAIPFTYNAGNYTAPPWFDAILTKSTELDDHDRPLYWYVWLHRRSVKYTIKAVYEDLWEENGHSVHKPRPEGWGLPYYGLVTEIADRYGNKTEIEYCQFRQWNCDNWTEFLRANPGVWGATEPPLYPCKECCQNCTEKGQIRRVQLRTASGNVAWTLLYTHRSFCKFPNSSPGWPTYEQWRQNALHSINVYPGDVDVADPCLTIPCEVFCKDATGQSYTSIDQIDAIEHPAIAAFEQSGARWTTEAKYLYTEYGDNSSGDCETFDLFGDVTAHSHEGSGFANDRLQGVRLVKTTVTRRTEQNGAPVSDRQFTVYRDGSRPEESSSPNGMQSGENANTFLREVFYPSTVASLMEARAQDTSQDVTTPNFLIDASIDDDPLIAYIDPATGTIKHKAHEDLASIFMKHWGTSGAYSFNSMAERRQLIPFFDGDEDRTLPVDIGRRELVDRRPESSSNGAYVFHNFIKYPSTWQNPTGQYITWPPDFSATGQNVIYHYPFRLWHPCALRNCPNVTVTEPLLDSTLSEPLYIMVIDERLAAGPAYNPLTLQGMKSRRVVEMNPAGFIVRNRLWKIVNGQAELLDQQGTYESYVYDSNGRLIEARSRGWSSAQNGDPAGDGLIHTFEYFGPSEDSKGELKAEGIKKGTGGPTHYIRRFERGEPDHPELVTKEVRFPIPTTDPDSDSGETIETTFEFGLSQTSVGEDEPIIGKTISRSRTARTMGEPVAEQRKAVERFEYNANGNLRWYGVGSLLNPAAPQTGDEFFVVFSGYDPYGRTRVQVVDLDPAAPPTHSEWPPTTEVIDSVASPPSWAIRQCEAPALNHVSIYEYDPTYGLMRTIYPNNREQRLAYVRLAGGSDVYQWIFNDLIPGDPFQVLSPVQIRLVRDGRLVWDRKVRLLPGHTDDSPNGWDNEGPAAGDTYGGIISTMTPTYDENGRMVGVQQGGEDSSLISGAISYDGFGNINRQEGPDGTITRNVYDELGRLQRVYRGTNDEHEAWGTAIACTSPGVPEGCVDEFADNLTLIEKREYGEGVHDANKLVSIRSYRDQPVNQYFETAPPGQPQPPENNEDDIGWLSTYEYDWRMRPVCEIRHDAGGAIVNQTFTWYDNLYRPRFVAEYGPVAPAPTDSANPCSLGAVSTLPTAQTILSATPLPLALSESIYNLRGQVEESRTYDVSTASGESYTATLTYYDHADRPIEVRSPNSPVQQYVYDAKGRQVVRRTRADGIEVTRTETTYDTNDRAIKTTQRERLHSAPGSDDLDDQFSNCIKTYVHNWYDTAGRLIATANYGTATSTFTSGAEPQYLPYYYLPPFGSPEFLLTKYGYDEAGRQSFVTHSDGSVTRYEYDDLGRVLLTKENANGSLGAPPKWTANKYDSQGRLEKMAAILPNGQGVLPVDYADIDWGATDGTVQVTKMIYGAEVVDSSGAAISANNGFLAEVRFPDKASGQPSGVDNLTFTYHSDGSVATRTDSKGNIFTHTYDELGRRTATYVDDSAWYPAPPPGSPSFAPPNRIQMLGYWYDERGNLTDVTAYGNDANGAPNVVISYNGYVYDAWGNLTQEVQEHYSGTGSRTVDYEWEFSPLAGGLNYSRLARIIYPQRVAFEDRLTVVHGHGASAGSIDSILNRITSITSPALGTFANYSYGGLSRRITSTLGCGVTQTFDPAPGGSHSGLDRFGRVTDLNFTLAGNTLHRYQYGYDAMGNRTFARVTQKAVGSVTHDNDRSSRYSYDGLQRLVDWQMGQLASDNAGIVPDGGPNDDVPIPRTIDWDMDSLGNWTGTGANPYGEIRTGDFNGDGVQNDPTWNFDHVVNDANQVTERWTGGTNPNPAYTYDPNGNMVHDWQYYYQYDAWNRLIQVNEIGSAVVEADGRLSAATQHQIGALICRYTYDGLGRLILKETPVSQGQTGLQIKNIYYDGVRRIQENITRPDLIEQMVAGGGGQQQEAEFAVAGEVANDELAVEIANAEPIAGGEPPPQTLMAGGGGPEEVGEVWTDRQYVYGPDYVDEFVCQLDRNNTPFYMLQDANYNVVAILSPTGQVRTQYAYEPYGLLVAVEHPSGGNPQTPVNRVGHQGLFYERYDGDYSDLTIAQTNLGLYYNRNRFYSPMLGRFIQRDPNETGMPILAALGSNGDAMFVLATGFSAEGLFGDGMNLYVYVGCNPVNLRDPLGLDDGWEDFDEMIGDLTGHRVASLGYISEGSGWVLFGTNAAVNIAGSLLGVDLFGSAKNILSGNGGFWDYVEVGATLTGAGVAAWKAFKWLKAYNKVAKKRKILAINKAVGKEFEQLVLRIMGWTKNNKKISHNGTNAIPDVLGPGKVIDIKSEINISKTPQLEAIAGWSKANGIRPKLVVSDRYEHASKWVSDNFDIEVFGE